MTVDGRLGRERRWAKAISPNLPGLVLLTPGAVAVVVLAVLPVALVARNSFATADRFGAVEGGFTWDNYARLMDPVYLKTLGYSLGMAVATTILSLIIGFAVASYTVHLPPARQGLVLLLIIVPFWTDFLVRTFSWINLLGSGGPIVQLGQALGLDPGPLVPSDGAVLLGLLYAFLPTAIFPIYAAMRSIDPSLREVADDLGCGWWQTQRRVILPLTAPGFIGAALLTFVPCLGVFVIPILLGGGKNPLVGNLIVTLYTEFRNQPMGAAVSVLLLVLMFVALGLGGLALWLRSRAQAGRTA